MKKIGLASLPDRQTKFELSKIAHEYLGGAGYESVGMDHFALKSDELAAAKKEGRLRRNFQGYATIPADDVIGFGISAIGDVRGAYIQNHKTLSKYKQLLDAGRLPVERGCIRSKDDELRRRVIHTLMCNFRIDIPEIETLFGVNFGEYFAVALNDLSHHEQEGLVTIGDNVTLWSGNHIGHHSKAGTLSHTPLRANSTVEQ